MTIDFSPTGGTARCLHSDLIPLQSIGTLTVRRASSVEFNEQTQQWEVWPASADYDTAAKVLFASPSRADCLLWEENNFELLT